LPGAWFHTVVVVGAGKAAIPFERRARRSVWIRSNALKYQQKILY
jgi:hypothetical protein